MYIYVHIYVHIYYGMYCPACGKVHIKDPLLLIGKSSLCGDSRIPPPKKMSE